MLRCLVMGDTHTGDVGGIVSPDDFIPRLQHLQEPLWAWFTSTIDSYGPFDLSLDMGDATEGEGKKDTIGLITTNTLKQAKMAAPVYERTKAKKHYMVRGTGYHVTGTYEYEDPLAEMLDASLKDEQYLDLNGLKVSMRHVVGRSDTPYGANTMIYKEVVRDLVTAIEDESEPADLTLRGHVHMDTEARVGRRYGATVPCLKYPGSVFGRKCRAFYYHMGVGILEIRNKDDWRYRSLLYPLCVKHTRDYEAVKEE